MKFHLTFLPLYEFSLPRNFRSCEKIRTINHSCDNFRGKIIINTVSYCRWSIIIIFRDWLTFTIFVCLHCTVLLCSTWRHEQIFSVPFHVCPLFPEFTSLGDLRWRRMMFVQSSTRILFVFRMWTSELLNSLRCSYAWRVVRCIDSNNYKEWIQSDISVFI